MPVLVWLSGPEYYLPQFLIVVFPGELPKLLFVCYWYPLIFVVKFWTVISCWYSVMVHPSSHKTPNNIRGAVIIFGKM